MKRKTLICKNCGEEISNHKAEICVKCGVRVRQNKVVKFFVVLLVIVTVVFGCVFGKIFIENIINESRRKSYVGTWELQTKDNVVSYEEIYDDKSYTHEILIDDKLEVTDENVYYGLSLSGCSTEVPLTERCSQVPPVVRLNNVDKIVAINFVTPDGFGVLLCFERKDDIITQVKCGTSNSDEYNEEGLYTMNGGINEKFDIVYKKVK